MYIVSQVKRWYRDEFYGSRLWIVEILNLWLITNEAIESLLFSVTCQRGIKKKSCVFFIYKYVVGRGIEFNNERRTLLSVVAIFIC